jgi:hypothetical protein
MKGAVREWTASLSNDVVFNQRLDDVVNPVMQIQNGDGVVIRRRFLEACLPAGSPGVNASVADATVSPCHTTTRAPCARKGRQN